METTLKEITRTNFPMMCLNGTIWMEMAMVIIQMVMTQTPSLPIQTSGSIQMETDLGTTSTNKMETDSQQTQHSGQIQTLMGSEIM